MNQEHYDILMEGVDVWNKWREENINIKPDLSNADLRDANLMDANLMDANLRKANLRNAALHQADLRQADLYLADLSDAVLYLAALNPVTLIDANLRNAKLRYANLNSANLYNANLYNADLGYVKLSDTDLRYANLSNADLRYADLSHSKSYNTDFRNAKLYNTKLDFMDLNNCKNLLMIHHNGPSTVGIQTLIQSKGQIPDPFLRGAGFPSWQIKAAKLYDPNLSPNQITDLVYEIDELRNSSPLQIHNLFISYTHTNEPFVKYLETHLREENISFWRDVHNSTAGPLESVVIRAMDHNPTVLLILSKEAIQSDWVEFEITKARELGKKLKRNVLCPIALDDSWKDKAYWKACQRPERLINWIQEYNILDFSNWQNDPDFDTKFNRLIKGLNLFYKK